MVIRKQKDITKITPNLLMCDGFAVSIMENNIGNIKLKTEGLFCDSPKLKERFKMKKLLITLALVAVLVAAPARFTLASDEGPVTFYGAFGGTAALNERAAVTSASVSIRFGIKTYLNAEGTWRLITEYNSINKPLKFDNEGKFVKSLDIGAEKLYWLGQREGFLAHSAFVFRGAIDFELNLPDNDNNIALGFGWLKKLSVDNDGHSLLSVQASLDMRLRNDEQDDVALFLALNLTPPVMR